METCFDLATALATWRQFQTRRHGFLEEDLDELEVHLRAHIAELQQQGWSQQAAFREAVRELGDLGEAEAAYRRVYWGKRRRQGRIRHELTGRLSMLKNYLKIAWRNLRKQKGYAFINVMGLSIGLTCSFFILLWVMNELSVDRFHEHGGRHFRVYRNENINGDIVTSSTTSRPMAEALKADYPEIEYAATILVTRGSFLVTYEHKSFRELGHYAGADFFQMFSFPLIQGNPATALQVENSVVITERVAIRLFGKDWRTRDVLGKTVNLDHDEDFTITGVAENVPDNSSLQFDVIVPIQAFYAAQPWTESWGNTAFPLFVQLQENANVSDVNTEIADITSRYVSNGYRDEVFLYPFEDTYLHGEFANGVSVGGRIDLIRIFGLVGAFLLVIAGINFMNLATARATQRSKEIGVRKAVGATQHALAGQFLMESMMLAGLAFILAMGLVVMLLPAFDSITGKQLGVTDLRPAHVALMFGIALVTGLLAGSYPALHLSSFDPVAILTGGFRQRPRAVRLRKGLVVFQFALSTLMIVSTLAVYFQIRYILEKDLGLNRDNVISLELEGAAKSHYEAFRQELLKQPGIVNVSASNANPLYIGQNTTFDMSWEDRDPDDKTVFAIIAASYDFVETMNMQIIAGRSFSQQFGSDSAGYVINERMANLMAKKTPVGERLAFWGQSGQILGVVKDFQTTTMDASIAPTVIRLEPEETHFLWIRAEPGKTQEALASLETVYKQFNTEYPFEYTFLDKTYETLYRDVLAMGKLAGVFAVIAILISCLGLFSLASFTAEQRTKEIGIRKVLGASVSGLVLWLSMDFTKLVLLGIGLAMPVAYHVVHVWLTRYQYHAEIGIGVFILAGSAAVLIAWLTVSYQSIKAALADPVKSLRYE